LPAQRSSSCESKAKVVTGVEGAFGVGPGRGILAAYSKMGAASAPRPPSVEWSDRWVWAQVNRSYLIPICFHLTRLWHGGESRHCSREVKTAICCRSTREQFRSTVRRFVVICRIGRREKRRPNYATACGVDGGGALGKLARLSSRWPTRDNWSTAVCI
jgi:hypothetical protein